jgi:phage-related baseplate assembly protein
LSNIQAFRNLPEINFVDKSVEELLADMVTEYEQAYFETTGEKKTLAPGDPVRIWIYTQALRIYSAYQLIDFSAKQNLLKYAEGEYLDNLGARVGVTRLPAAAAICTVRFTLSVPQASIVAIPEGTSVTPGGNVFFETMEYVEIPAGDPHIDIVVRCTEPGTIGNGYTVGQINTLVNPISYIASVSNVDISQGGSDVEADDSLRERIFLKPESFSVAGPKDAYVFFAKEYSPSIADVAVSSPSAGAVDIRFVLQDGELPDATLISELQSYLSEDNRRPLTDNVTVQAPTQVSYSIALTYYIGNQDAAFSSSIQTAVNAAVQEYVTWQKSKIGRDINPSELLSRIMQAGAKRAVITAPIFTSLTSTQVATEGTIAVTYGGLEDD